MGIVGTVATETVGNVTVWALEQWPLRLWVMSQCEQKKESCVSLAGSHPIECTFSMIINMMCFLPAKQVTVIFSDAG